MMEIYISYLLISIFLVLAIIHFIWAMGSEWAFDKVLPIDKKGDRLFTPLRLHSLIVGLGLLLVAMIYAQNISLLHMLPQRLHTIALYIIPSVFLLRAIGDMNYVGFFKKVKNTSFSEMDTRLFSPLCLFLSLAGLYLVL